VLRLYVRVPGVSSMSVGVLGGVEQGVGMIGGTSAEKRRRVESGAVREFGRWWSISNIEAETNLLTYRESMFV